MRTGSSHQQKRFPNNMTENKKSLHAKLSDEDLMYLQEGRKSGASREEKDRATAILKKISGKNARATQRKRGPKPASMNSTEEEIRQRIASIRRIVGHGAKDVAILQLLGALCDFFENHNLKIGAGLYFSASDIYILEDFINNPQIVEQWTNLLPQMSPRHRFLFPSDFSTEDIIELMDHLYGIFKHKSEKHAWRTAFQEPLKSSLNVLAKELDEADLYLRLNKALTVDAEEFSQLGFSDSTSRPMTLKMAQAKISAVHKIFRDCRFISTTSSIELLYQFGHAIALEFWNRNMPAHFFTLDEIFMNAINRQKCSPFVPMCNEEYGGFGLHPSDEDLC